MEPRPVMSAELRFEVTKKLIERMLDEVVLDLSSDEDEVKRLVREVIYFSKECDDGYRIAKNLEDGCGWQCDFDIAEAFNDLHPMLKNKLFLIEEAWAEENHMEPPFEVGTTVIYGDECGVIMSILGRYKYSIKQNGLNPGIQRVVNFEDVKAIST